LNPGRIYIMHFKIITFILLLLACGITSRAQGNGYPEYDTASPGLLDIQRVIDASLPDVEAMLKKKNSFLPFATVILANDSLADISIKDSTKTVYTADDLKEELSIGALKGLYKAVVIFSVDEVPDPVNEKPKKAIAVFAEHTDDDFAYLFYYPYAINAKRQITFSEPFGDFAQQVMFKP